MLAVDLREDAAAETCALIHSEGGAATSFVADVSSSADTQAAVAACVDRYHRVDVLHNNVGIVTLGGPVEISDKDWDRVFRVNVKSVFLTCKHVLPHMERQGGGSIINVSSVGAIRDIGVPYIAYATSKAAVIQASQSVALQYAAKGIRCNVILPGLISTPHIVGTMTGAYGDVESAKSSSTPGQAAPSGGREADC